MPRIDGMGHKTYTVGIFNCFSISVKSEFGKAGIMLGRAFALDYPAGLQLNAGFLEVITPLVFLTTSTVKDIKHLQKQLKQLK